MSKLQPLPDECYLQLIESCAVSDPVLALEAAHARKGDEKAIAFVDKELAERPELLGYQPTLHYWSGIEGEVWEDIPPGEVGEMMLYVKERVREIACKLRYQMMKVALHLTPSLCLIYYYPTNAFHLEED